MCGTAELCNRLFYVPRDRHRQVELPSVCKYSSEISRDLTLEHADTGESLVHTQRSPLTLFSREDPWFLPSG